jgi:hypothetical protein
VIGARKLYGNQGQALEIRVQESRFVPLLKGLSYLVLLLMVIGAGYTFVISMMHWSGIAV